MELLVEIVGWAAAGMFLAAYALLTAGRLTARSRLYQWLNVAGAAGFIVNSGVNGAYPSAAVNVIWMGIGIAALWQISRAKRAAEAAE